jgi:hypothetical protein
MHFYLLKETLNILIKYDLTFLKPYTPCFPHSSAFFLPVPTLPVQPAHKVTSYQLKYYVIHVFPVSPNKHFPLHLNSYSYPKGL